MAAAANPSGEAATDAELVVRLRAGDELAFTRLYRRHARYIAGVAYRLFGEDSELEDTVQEAFLAAVRALPSLEDPARFRSWLVTITVRTVRRRIGKRQKRRRIDKAVEAVTPVAPAVSDPEDQAEVDALYEALGQISHEYRTPWVLHRVEGQTLPEAAEACEVSLATVKRRIAEADKRLKRRLRA